MLLITKLTKQILLEAKLISKDHKVLTTLVVQTAKQSQYFHCKSIHSSDSPTYFLGVKTNEIFLYCETPVHLALTCILGDHMVSK